MLWFKEWRVCEEGEKTGMKKSQEEGSAHVEGRNADGGRVGPQAGGAMEGALVGCLQDRKA